MLWKLIFTIAGPLLALLMHMFGDAVLAKWLGQLKLLYRSKVDPVLKAKVDLEFDLLCKEWDDLKQDRKPGPRQ